MKYVHYGSSTFDPLRWVPVRNAPFEKSFEKRGGGLWASPVDAKKGWANWCRNEDFGLEMLENYFEFDLSESAKVLQISSEDVAKTLPRILDDPEIIAYSQRFPKLRHSLFKFPIDFEQLCKDYDVIEFTASQFFYPDDILRGWDCDCILVLNKDVICVSGLKE